MTRITQFVIRHLRRLRVSSIALQTTFALLISVMVSLDVQSQVSTPVDLAHGVTPSTYELNGFDRINMFSRKVDFLFPLFGAPGRGAVSAGVGLPGDAYWVERVFETDQSITVQYGYVPPYNNNFGNFGEGWFVPGTASVDKRVDPVYTDMFCGGGFRHPQSRLSVIKVTIGDGTEIVFHSVVNNGGLSNIFDLCNPPGPFNRGRVFVSSNSEASTFITDTDVFDDCDAFCVAGGVTGTMMTRDGLRYRFEGGRLVRITDTNGNYVAYTWGTSAVTSITDSIGRRITLSYTNQIGGHDTITYKGFGGDTRQVKVWYSLMESVMRQGSSTKTCAELFPPNGFCFTGSAFNPVVISKIEYPGTPGANSMHFYYNSYGEISRVILPTGGGYDYHIESGGLLSNRFIGLSYRALQKRVIFRDLTPTTDPNNPPAGAVVRQELYSMSYQSGFRHRVITVETRDGNNIPIKFNRHYFFDEQTADCRSSFVVNTRWDQGREWKIEEYQVNNGIIGPVLKTIEHFYTPTPAPSDQGGCSVGPHPNPKIIETKVTLNDANLVSKQSYAYDGFHNRTDTWEYGFGPGAPGALIRRTHTTYLTTNPHQGGVNYATDLNIHIRDLPVESIVYDASGSLSSETDYIYDDYGALPLVDCPGIVGHDGAFHTGYGARGNLTEVINRNPGGSPSEVRLKNQYDIAGNVVKAVDGRGAETDFDYSDHFGAPDDEAQSNSGAPELAGGFTYAFSTKVTNDLDHTTHTQYDYYIGQPVNSEDFNEIVSSVTYDDPLDRPTQGIRARWKVNSGAPAERRQTTFSYDDANRLVTATSDQNTFNDNAMTSKSYYDGLRKTWRTATYEGGSWAIIDTKFDALGRVSQVSNSYRAADPDSASPPAGVWTKSAYDALGRIIDVETPDGAHVISQYSGVQATVIDQAGKKRRSETDALGRLIKVIEDPDGLSHTTHYSHDALGNLRTVTQGAQTRTYVYDSLSRLISATNPESGTITHVYDPNGNVLETADARGVRTTFTYDDLNRIESKVYAGTTPEGTAAANATPRVRYFYDNYSGLPSGAPMWPGTPSKGRLVGVTYGTGSEGTYYKYDAVGKIVINHQRQGIKDYATTYTYNLAGGATREQRGTYLRNSWTYDNAGRVRGMEASFTPFITFIPLANNISYTPFGALQSETYGNGLIHSIGYNNRQQPTEMRLGRPDNLESVFTIYPTFGTAHNVNGQDAEISLVHNNGNIARVKYSVSGTIQYAQTFQYDPLNRLRYAVEHNNGAYNDGARAWYQTFNYDQHGNRGIDVANTSDNADAANSALRLAEFSPANNRITRAGFVYDAGGNLIAESGGTYSYDAENRLVTATLTGGVTSRYFYDGNGFRVKKIVGAVAASFEYGAGGELIAERNDATGVVTKAYCYRGAELLATTTNGTTYEYATADHLGSPRAWTDASGNVVTGGRHDYMPFGEELFAGYGTRTTAQRYATTAQQDGQRKQFGSKERDIEITQDYFGARYYSSLHGRFTSPDAAFADQFEGNPQSWNLYSYVRNNPLVNVDPNGKETCYYQRGERQPIACDNWTGVVIKGDTLTYNGKSYSLSTLEAQYVVRSDPYIQIAADLGVFQQRVPYAFQYMTTTPSKYDNIDPRTFVGPPIPTGEIVPITGFRGGADFINDAFDVLEWVDEKLAPREDIYEMGGGQNAVLRAVVKLTLRGRSLVSGSKALRRLGLRERVTKTGRHEFYDPKTGSKYAAWDPKNSKGPNHWHKFPGRDDIPLNHAGRVVPKESKAAHIPSK